MSTWLESLPAELKGINEWDFIEPDYVMEETDHQIGEMSEPTRRLYTFGRLLEKSARQSLLDSQFCNDKVKKLELETKAHELKMKSNIVKEMMWISLRDEYGVWSDNIGVRVGFKVVTSPAAEDNIPPIIKGLFNL